MGEAFNAVDGVRISFQESSAGPTIVLVHGSGLSRAIWRGLGYTKALEERFHVVTLDLRGHGRSDKPQHENAYSMDLLVGDIVAVLDAARVQTAHYVGYYRGRENRILTAGQQSRACPDIHFCRRHIPLPGRANRIDLLPRI